MKRYPELRQLSEDHHHGLVLARKARREATEKKSVALILVWKEISETFRLELEPHFQIEEQYLAPPLLELGEEKLIERFNREHRQLRMLVKDQDNWSLTTLHEFGKLLENHIRFEERELFEVAQQRLTPEHLKTIKRACKKPSR